MGGTVTSGITEAQRQAIESIAKELEEDTYLAGGVAVAIRARHRTSLDVDLFVPRDFDADRLADHRHACLEPPAATEACPVPVAAMEDLACMKVSAIAGRGAAKDFWDLHELLEMGIAEGSLASVLKLYRRKYPVEDLGYAVRSLAYFGDADAAPLPRGLSSEHWEEIKSAMRRRVLELDRED